MYIYKILGEHLKQLIFWEIIIIIVGNILMIVGL